MRNKKIGLVGYLGYSVEHPIIGGQMNKTRGIYTELINKFGKSEIICVDTSNWKREKIKLLKQCFLIAKNCNRIIIMPNKNGIKFILPFFSCLKFVFHYKISYPVVGGWLSDLLEKNRYLVSSIKNIDYILPETKALAKELTNYYNGDIDVMPIFSTRKAISPDKIQRDFTYPYNFCTFSRVTPEKGIDDAIEVISKINDLNGKTICTLDVWGPIESGYEERYEKVFTKNKSFVNYKGILAGDNCLQVLSKYYMLIFPTYYFGEGFPTTICESFMAALPVISSTWRFNTELVENKVTGLIFETRNLEALQEAITYSIENPKLINAMRDNALNKSKFFEPEIVMEKLVSWIIS